MFAYTGMTKEMCEKLINKHHIFLTKVSHNAMRVVTSCAEHHSLAHSLSYSLDVTLSTVAMSVLHYLTRPNLHTPPGRAYQYGGHQLEECQEDCRRNSRRDRLEEARW